MDLPAQRIFAPLRRDAKQYLRMPPIDNINIFIESFFLI